MQTKFFNQGLGRVIVGGVLIALMMLFWKGLEKNPIIPSASAAEKAFPDFSLADPRYDNKAVTLGDVKGKPFVVHIWASWCGACMMEHPFWVGIKEKYDFPLVGIVYRDSAKKVIPLLAKKNDPYGHLLMDPSGVVGLDLGIAGIPATFVVDAKGKICYTHFGEVTKMEFEKKILPLLGSTVVSSKGK